MTDELALLAAILSGPSCDTPRLVYADFLDERGEAVERAELIRVQIRKEELKQRYDPISPLPADHETHGEWLRLYRREQSLLANGGRWSDWPKFGHCANVVLNRHIAPIGAPSFEFSRGFLSRLTCAWADWLANHAACYWWPGQTIPCPDCATDGSPRARYAGWQWRKPPWNTAMLTGCGSCGGTPSQTNDSGIQGSGTLPRPFPGKGVQPLECVVLTSWPRVEFGPATPRVRNARLQGCEWRRLEGEWRGGQDLERTAAYALLKVEWPRIRFELPSMGLDTAAGRDSTAYTVRDASGNRYRVNAAR